MKLEDLTKQELITLIMERSAFGPRTVDIMYVRWRTLSKQALDLLAEPESKSPEQFNRDYEKHLKITEKADALYAKILRARGGV